MRKWCQMTLTASKGGIYIIQNKEKLRKKSIILKIFIMIVKNHRLNFKKKTKR